MILDEATDLTTVVERGGSSVSASIADRQRLASMRKLERAREAAHQTLISKAAQSSDDMVALSVQAIRHSMDSSQYAMSKLSTSVKQIADSIHATRNNVERAFPNGLRDRKTQPPQHLEPSDGAQLRATVSEKDAKISEAIGDLQVARARLSTAEFQVKRSELDLQRKEEEVSRLSKDSVALEQEVHRLRDELRTLRDEMRNERDTGISQLREVESRQNQALRELLNDHEAKMRAARATSAEELRKKEEELAKEHRRAVASEEKEERMRAVLEESKQKRNSLKKQRDLLQDDLSEARQVIAQQNKELQHAQDIIESLTVEVERTKAALEHEASQQERDYLHTSESAAFREWKKVHKAAPSSAASKPTVITPRSKRPL